ncbi:muscarinic acetylcholine receptor M5 [Nasonia vitripennis]|uniref:G-protein coupled receptors family 1 profile domain-containing protein n=1 Tax=Nasonia vitripennis TaxID=7425 RepID=A0A7M7LUU9_NASVI|nr:muscarinic acetylcholine receptor M5 [Nasonia vitripennis]XP_008211718.1 muscarinic acetylcholine receptor M5 [Nasonia vitripennis]XP_008211724.1 muscarinic acetylcholine receptor M5 [Nasonia vitripennis]XP_008211729.1 muscarinic acetylcholine receptor M5 [Nasonia vitripennis]
MDGGSTEDAGGGSFAGLGSLEGWRAPSKIAIWCLVLCGSLLLNATLLVAFIRRPGLRTISNRFVMNLIASNLLAAIVLTGLLITDSCGLSSLTSSGAPSLCALAEGAMAFVTTSSILSVLLIGVDQYLAVVDPLRYRTRIDKLKCALLILAVWLIALLFAGLASLNPEPRSLCWPAGSDDAAAGRRELSFQASLLLGDAAGSNSSELEIEGEIRFDEEEEEERNATASSPPGLGAGVTYGLIYALLYALLGYLLPFLAICWIYVSIYTAARSNSERTRRNGSRPMLSSGSFSEEPGSRPDASLEDFRRIPKISSLSSIDENSEACPSPNPQQQEQRLEPEEQTAVIFTVGSSQVQQNAKDSTQSKVPIAALRAQFLQQDDEPPAATSSRFPEVSGQRRKSSHDLMYEEMMLGSRHPYEYDDDDDDGDDDGDDDEFGHSSDEEQPPRHEEDCEEALPLSQQQQPRRESESGAHSSTRSISVNFDLSEPPKEPQQQQPPPPPIVTITPPGQKSAASSVPLQRAPSVKSNSHSYIHNLKYRISNGSLFKYREETRAARISALVIVMGLICWTPYVYVLLSRNLPGLSPPQEQSSGLDATALGFLVLASYISPLLFGYRSRRVKRELRKFFCFKRELSYKNNRSLMAKKVLRRRHSGATILGIDASIDNARYNIFNCVYGRNRWPKEKVQFVQVPETALAVETCRSSFSSGASTQISSTSTDEC